MITEGDGNIATLVDHDKDDNDDDDDDDTSATTTTTTTATTTTTTTTTTIHSNANDDVGRKSRGTATLWINMPQH